MEIYEVGSGWSPEYLAPWDPPLYPRLVLLPDGDIFYAGETIDSHLFHPANQTWTLNIAETNFKQSRTYGSVVLLPLRPEEGYAARVMTMGGYSPATTSVEIIEPMSAKPAWTYTGPMSEPRTQMNATLLPTGKVIALGGSEINEDIYNASLDADLYDPASGVWSPAGTEEFARLYHSVSLLLPDATVWVAGGNPVRGTYEEHMEIYTPPYLFAVDPNGNVIPAPRPTITSAPAEIGYGSSFKVTTPDALLIRQAVLVRPSSVSHAFDFEQRLIGLTFNANGSTVRAVAPPNGFIAPPGYYMLFLIDQAGVPSVAKFVHLSATPQDQPPKGSITLPATDLTITAGKAVRFVGSAQDADGTVATYSWNFPGGTPATSSARNPGTVTFTEPGTHVVSLTAIDDLGVNDPSPPTRTITVTATPAKPAHTSFTR